MPRYLLTVNDANAQRLEAFLGTALRIGPAWEDTFQGVLVAGLDAVTDEELAPVLERLKTSGPRYHFGGPESAVAATTRAEAAAGRLIPTAPDAAVERLRSARSNLPPPRAILHTARASHGFCTANARRGTGTGICNRPLDSLGQCDRASDHLE